MSSIKKYVAEFIGTMVLVLVGCVIQIAVSFQSVVIPRPAADTF